MKKGEREKTKFIKVSYGQELTCNCDSINFCLSINRGKIEIVCAGCGEHDTYKATDFISPDNK